MGVFGQVDVLMPEWHLQGLHHGSKQLNGAPGSHAGGAGASAAQEASGTMQHIPGQEQAVSAAAETAEQKLKQHGQADREAAEAEQAASAPKESDSRADNSAGQLQAQQKPQESPVSKGVPRLRIPPLSPRPASGLELPGSRAAQPDSSAKSRGNAPEQSPDEGWSPRQVSMCRTSHSSSTSCRSWAV